MASEYDRGHVVPRSRIDPRRLDRHRRHGPLDVRARASTKGYTATVYNRTQGQGRSRCSSRGEAWADTPKAVARASDVVFAIVGFPKDVREVFLGADGALAGSKPGRSSWT